MQQLSDEELIEKYRSGGSSGPADPYVNELFRRHHRRVALWCLRFTGNREEAADLTQEILANTFRRLDTFQGNSKFTTWLYAVCRNHCLNAVKSKSSRPDLSAEELPEAFADPAGEPIEDRLTRESRMELIRTWIQENLSDTERQVIVMHFLDEVPLDTITKVLRLSNASGAKAFVVSARRKLADVAKRWRAQTARRQPND